MEWYFPLTVLPAIALIILSTSNFLVALNVEVDKLERKKDVAPWVIDQKIVQLKRLGIAIILLYSSALFFMFSSLTSAIHKQAFVFKFLMVTAATLFTVALIFLFIHAIKAINIRQKHLKQ